VFAGSVEDSADPLEKLLPYLADMASAAPSPANVRPWRFRHRTGSLQLLLGDYRDAAITPEAAPRQAVIGCGAALFNLVLAVGHLGFQADVDILVDKDMPALGDVIASITLGRQRPPRPDEERLFAAVPLRRSYRSPQAGPAPSRTQLRALQLAAKLQGCRLIEITGEHRAFLDEVVASTERTVEDNTARHGLRGAWIRADNQSVRTLVLCTAEDTPESWISAGQGLEHVLLEATCLGLAPHLATLPLEVTESREALRTNVVPHAWPQLVLQIGRTS
jgi:hypothetical protein